MRIAIASDHAGFSLKQHLVTYLIGRGHDVRDLGVDSDAVSTDYPDAARKVADVMINQEAERGVLVCGSGVGVSIAANKFPGIYACLIHDTYSAHQGVEHDRMNVICLGAKIIGSSLAEEVVDTFLNADFSGVERYGRRFKMVQDIEQKHGR